MSASFAAKTCLAALQTDKYVRKILCVNGEYNSDNRRGRELEAHVLRKNDKREAIQKYPK
jgi:hypothetical protein